MEMFFYFIFITTLTKFDTDKSKTKLNCKPNCSSIFKLILSVKKKNIRQEETHQVLKFFSKSILYMF